MSTLRTNNLQTTDSSFTIAVSALASQSDLSNSVDVTKGAAKVGRAVQGVSSVAALKTLSTSGPSKFAETSGYYAPGDGGAATYFVPTSFVGLVDNGGTVIAADDGGFWLLRNTGSLNVRQFGAKGDSTTDDTAAFQAAINALPVAGGVVTIPNGGFWRVEGVLSLGPNVKLVGSGSATTTLIKNTTANCKFFDVTGESCRISGLRVIGLGASSLDSTFAIETQPAAGFFQVDDFHALNVAGGVFIRSNSFRILSTTIRQLKVGNGVGIAVDQSAVLDGIGYIDNTLIINAGGSEGFAGIQFIHAVGILVSNTQLAQCGQSIVIAPPVGKTVTSIKIANTYFDTSDNGGLNINNSGAGNISRITVADSWLSSAISAAGLRIFGGSSVQGLMVSNCEFYDNSVGIQVDASCTLSNFEINNSVFAGNAVSDISIGASNSNFSLRGNRTGAIGGFGASPVGLFINAGCINYSVVNNDLHLFTDAAVGTGTIVANNRIANWGYAAITLDPASIANGTGQTFTIGVPGARFGDIVNMAFSLSLDGLELTGYVSANDVVSGRLFNSTGAPVDLASGTVKATITRRS